MDLFDQSRADHRATDARAEEIGGIIDGCGN